MSSNDPQPDAAELRARAEALALGKASPSPEHLAALSPEATRAMLHELQVHQIELELQNEELRREQLALEDSRARYFDLYDLAPVGYVIVSELGLILEVNLTTATMLGVPRTALVERPISRFILKEDQNLYYLHRSRLRETGEPQVFDVRMVKPNGPPCWAQLRVTDANDTDGAAVCRVTISDIIERKRAEAALQRAHDELEQRVAERTAELQQANEALLTDITARKQAEVALREVEERHRGLVESAFDGSVIHQNGIIVDASATYAKIFGYTVDELIGKPVLELTAPEVRDVVADITRRHDAAPYETVGLRKDGSRFPIEGSGRTCTYRGRLARIAAVRDLTARRQMEAEVARKTSFLSLLHQFGPSLSKLASPADIPERISTLIGHVFDNRNLYIALYDEATGRVSFPIYRIAGESRDSLVQRPCGNGLTEYVIRTRTPLLISDRMDEAMAERGITLIGTPSRCYLGAPMLMGERVIGVIAVQDYEQANVFDSSHVELLATIAADAAVAFSNAHLLEGTRKELLERRKAEAALRETQERLAHAMDQAHLVYWEMDATTQTFTFNDRFYALYATTAEREGGYRMSAETYTREFLPPEEQHVVPDDIGKLPVASFTRIDGVARPVRDPLFIWGCKRM